MTPARPPAQRPAPAARRAATAIPAPRPDNEQPSAELPAAELPADAVEVGRVAEAWGVRGGLKIHTFSADGQALIAAAQWFIQAPASPPAPRLAWPGTLALPVRQVRAQGDALVATSPLLTDRDAAQRLRGARIFVSRSHFPPPQEGEYYWVDLIGLNVQNREGIMLGRVHQLLNNTAQTVLVLHEEKDGKKIERMIPFVSAFIDSVNLADKLIIADWQPDY